MVVEVDVAADGGVQVLVGRKRLPVIQIGLHRFVPGFHVRVVVHAVGAVDRLREAGTLQLSLEVTGDELDAAVGMEHGSLCRLSCAQRRMHTWTAVGLGSAYGPCGCARSMPRRRVRAGSAATAATRRSPMR